MSTHLLYLSYTGALQPLGYSQVVRPLIKLARRGFHYTLLTMERAESFQDSVRLEEVRRELSEAGVDWYPSIYRPSVSLLDIASNLFAWSEDIHRVMKRGQVRLVHARGYPAALVACALRARYGTPYLFDTRGFWVDEVREEGRRFMDPASYSIARVVERLLYRQAAGAVCLAEDGAQAIAAGEFGPWRQRPLAVIPTCVDAERFEAQRSIKTPLVRRLQEQLADKIVFAHVGSLNSSYKTEESIRLFTHIMRGESRAHFLGLTAQQDVLWRLLESHGVPRDRCTVERASHAEMPALLDLIDWGFLLLKTSSSKRASMPTKLGEFLVAGVRPIHYGCNEDTAKWVSASDVGITLRSLTEEGLAQGARDVLKRLDEDVPRSRAWENTAAYFSLESGVKLYAELLRTLL